MGRERRPQTASAGHKHAWPVGILQQCCVPCAAIVGGSAAALALVILLTWLTRREGAWAQRQRSPTERAETQRRELRGRIANAGATETEVQPAGARPATCCGAKQPCFCIIEGLALWRQVAMTRLFISLAVVALTWILLLILSLPKHPNSAVP